MTLARRNSHCGARACGWRVCARRSLRCDAIHPRSAGTPARRADRSRAAPIRIRRRFCDREPRRVGRPRACHMRPSSLQGSASTSISAPREGRPSRQFGRLVICSPTRKRSSSTRAGSIARTCSPRTIRSYAVPRRAVRRGPLGVLRDIDGKKALVAILGINSSLFDIMPPSCAPTARCCSRSKTAPQLGEFMLDADKRWRTQSISRKLSAYQLAAVIRIDKTCCRHGTAKPTGRNAVSLALGVLCASSVADPADRGPVADLDRRSRVASSSPISSRSSIFGPARSGLRDSGRAGCARTARCPADELHSTAESSGRIEAMTWQLLGRALTDLQPHLKADKDFKLSFNVVPSTS